jgi:hypothetical protein
MCLLTVSAHGDSVRASLLTQPPGARLDRPGGWHSCPVRREDRGRGGGRSGVAGCAPTEQSMARARKPQTEKAGEFVCPEWLDSKPAWSPDGKLIAFSRRRAPARGDRLYVMRLDGTGARALRRDSLEQGSPAWSPKCGGDRLLARQQGWPRRDLRHARRWLGLPPDRRRRRLRCVVVSRRRAAAGTRLRCLCRQC